MSGNAEPLQTLERGVRVNQELILSERLYMESFERDAFDLCSLI